MQKINVSIFMSLILFLSCAMLLAPIGLNIPKAQAYYSQNSDVTAKVTPVKIHPDPATQTVTVTYEIINAVFEGEWWVQLNTAGWFSGEEELPINSRLKKSLNSEKKNGKISGSWTIPLWHIAGANQPVPLGIYEFRFYGPKNQTGYLMYSNEVVQGQQYNNTNAYFTVVENTDVILSCPSTATPGDKINISWQKASQNIGAWIGIFKKGDPDTAPLKKLNINQGSISSNGSGQWTMDHWLWAGEYEFRIFQDNGYIINGKIPIVVHYKTPNLTVQPQQGRPNETLVINWTNGPNYVGYGDSVRVDLYQGDKFYTNLQTGVWPEGTINFKIRNNTPPGMYQVRMINGHDESVMTSVNLGVQAAQTSPASGSASSSTDSTGTSTTTQTTSTGSSGAPSTTTTASTGASTASTSATTIVLNGGQPTMTVNGVSREIVPGQDAESMIINGRLYAPVQPIAEAMGGKVEWDSREKKMTISMAGCDNATQGVTSSNNTSESASAPAGQNPIIGLWKITEGTTSNQYIYMYQEGGKIAGMFNDRSIITGSMTGNVFKGEYHGTVNPNGSAITMTLSDDGLSFEGMYHFSIKDRPIRGAKNIDATAKIKATPTMGASDSDFNGTWGTTAGNIIITQEGTKVRGTWEDKTITGKVEGNVLNGRYYSTRYPEMIWDFNMTMRPDGKTCVLFHTKQGGVLINTWRK
jgi:hypothetical protein